MELSQGRWRVTENGEAIGPDNRAICLSDVPDGVVVFDDYSFGDVVTFDGLPYYKSHLEGLGLVFKPVSDLTHG
jgi:hypothetical protein